MVLGGLFVLVPTKLKHKVFDSNYERISTHSLGSSVFGIIVKVRKDVENPEDVNIYKKKTKYNLPIY